MRRVLSVILVACLALLSQAASGDQCGGNAACAPMCCMDDSTCSVHDDMSQFGGENCSDDCECISDECNTALQVNECTCKDHDHCSQDLCCMEDSSCSEFGKESRVIGESCNDDCECFECLCAQGFCASPPPGMEKDPILHGLRGQTVKWAGAEGGWYSLFVDKESGLQVNVRPTGPLPEKFPERQYLTGIAVLSRGHSLAIEVKDPYSISTSGCPANVSPCLADGALRISVDGEEEEDLLAVTMGEQVTDDIYLSASNLPAECREFGGGHAWANLLSERLKGQRYLPGQEKFEDWVVASSHNAVSPESCAEYVSERGLMGVVSKQSVLRIITQDVVVRFGVGVNHRRGGKVDGLGRDLPELDFWQGSVELTGVSLEHENLSGMLGETARPVIDEYGREVLEGLGALRGAVEDYRVAGSEGTDFALGNIESP